MVGNNTGLNLRSPVGPKSKIKPHGNNSIIRYLCDMNWNNIFSEKRIGSDTTSKGVRTQFQRDFDRLIFSSSFRRLQNKTQVFPLPGSTFVHNRLTHSLEVASVGRSLGKIVGEELSKKDGITKEAKTFYKYELQNVVATAGLAHDIGNPAFGHSGEKAISKYFLDNTNLQIESKELMSFFSLPEWADLTSFEGNANALRVLTHTFRGKAPGGLGLTITTLASLLKYPCESVSIDKKIKHRKKYGFFQAEKDTVREIFSNLNMIKESDNPVVYKRHPFVYLTEAADDICYRILDMEDALRLGIIEESRVTNYFIRLLESINHKDDNIDKIRKTLEKIEDRNERITYLRAKCINALTLESADIFLKNSDSIILGTYNNSLVDSIEDDNSILKKIRRVSYEEIYNHDTVLEIEIAGYHVISELLSLFIPAVLKKNPDNKDQKLLRLIPNQFTADTDSAYVKALSVLDYVTGMTDLYATELYRKISGIDIPRHR